MKSPSLLLRAGTWIWPCIAALTAINSTPALAQSAPASFDSVVDNYVSEGLSSNLALRTEGLEVEKAAAALSEARANFFPNLSFEARYTRAEGGRDIQIPIGSALNPVYSTLNDMLVA